MKHDIENHEMALETTKGASIPYKKFINLYKRQKWTGAQFVPILRKFCILLPGWHTVVSERKCQTVADKWSYQKTA